MRVATCQMNSQGDKPANIQTALELLEKAAAQGADLAVHGALAHGLRDVWRTTQSLLGKNKA